MSDYHQYWCDLAIFGVSYWRIESGRYLHIAPERVVIEGDTYTYVDVDDRQKKVIPASKIIVAREINQGEDKQHGQSPF